MTTEGKVIDMVEKVRVMSSRTSVWFQTSFIALHCWPDAPDDVFYLRDTHRHVFKVRVDLVVYHDDRNIEFISAKERLDEWLSTQPGNLGTTSCEMLCERIANFMDAQFGAGRCIRVEVSEDGENGATLERA